MIEKSMTQISIEDVRELFDLVGEIQDLFHQPMYYRDIKKVEKFADTYYPTIHKIYYETLWDLLPQEDKERIRDS